MEDIISTRLERLRGCAAAARTDIGRRPTQQDRAMLRGEEDFLFAALCDGMGGTQRGGMASQRAMDVLRQLLEDEETLEMAQTRGADFLDLAFTAADQSISGDSELQGSGTTLTALLLNGRQALWASAGDSRLYILRDGEMLQATRDHNYRLYLNELRDRDLIRPERYEAELARARALISFIGIGKLRLMDLSLEPLEVRPGDIFLLTSDGLTGVLTDGEICGVLESGGPLERRADQLMETALERGKDLPMDNTTFIIVQIL